MKKTIDEFVYLGSVMITSQVVDNYINNYVQELMLSVKRTATLLVPNKAVRKNITISLHQCTDSEIIQLPKLF